MSFRSLALAAVVAAITFSTIHAQTGKKEFESRCAVCHGGDGNGGEFAPGIITVIANRSDTDIASIIENGVPSKGMPAVPATAAERSAIVGYLRTLRAPVRGEMIPVPAEVKLVNGTVLKGVSLNRTSDEMQIRTPDNRLHLLRTSGTGYREVTSQSDWTGYNGNPGGNRYSPLTQINSENAHRLTPKWIFSMPDTRPLEGTPVVLGGVMYVSAGNECYALDAGSGRAIWHYQRAHTKGYEAKVNRGVTVSGDRLFMATDNAHLIALNRFNGELLWETPMADYKQNYFATSAPLLVGDLVVSGVGGGDSGVRGFLAAFDAATGKEVWRFWTIPAEGEPGSETWKGGAVHGGGATWITGSYDPELKLVYWQVGNPGPDHNGDNRLGDNLYSDSVIALDPATGKLKWHYQFTPHDVWDWDAQEPLLLVDTQWKGQPRKLLIQANRNGFLYVMDRATGELLMGKPFIKKLTWASGIGTDGRPVLNPNQVPTEKGTTICPTLLGGTNWWSASFDASLGLFYVHAMEGCSIFVKGQEEWQAGRSYTGGSSRIAPAHPPERIVRAIDISTGKFAWEVPQVGPGESRSGTLVTAGHVLFFGDDTGSLRVLDSRTGKSLWSFQTGQLQLKASPMTYVFDQQQYVALASGSNVIAYGLMTPRGE